jgi:membrane protease YdiL (CAAX protease family)
MKPNLPNLPDLPGRPAYLALLPEFLFRTDELKSRYLLKAWVLALLPSLVLSALVASLLPDAGQPDFAPEKVGMPYLVFLLVVVSPIIETLVLAPLVLVLNRFLGAGPAVVLSALLWAAAHSLEASAWGLVIWWPFLIMSIALLTWREAGLWTAIAMVVAIHMLQNAFGAVLLLTFGGGH